MYFFAGKYPCICGASDDMFKDRARFNAKMPFASLTERTDHLHLTETWTKALDSGNLAPFESMKVCYTNCYNKLVPFACKKWKYTAFDFANLQSILYVIIKTIIQ